MTILYHDAIFQKHQTGPHPECPARLKAIDARLGESGLLGKLPRGEISRATHEQIGLVHDDDYRQHLYETAEAGGGRIEADTVVSSLSYEV
ncbi:MAG: histone deacetylase, partial [Planctomyces sp.]|nr:histone deacetylase [Planctomyces sp.]